MKVIKNGLTNAQDADKRFAESMAKRGVRKISQNTNPYPSKVCMLSHTFRLAPIIFILFFATNGCDKLRRFDPSGIDISKIPITIEDYSLESSGCSWNFNGLTQDSVYVIDSEIELMNFVSCMGSILPPNIDFNEHSLLLVQGNTLSGSILTIDKSLKCISKNNYKLNVDVRLNDASPSQPWLVAVKVPKLAQNAVVQLNALMYIQCEDTISFTNYPLTASHIAPVDTFFIFNSNAELIAFKGYIPVPIDFNKHTLVYVLGRSPNLAMKIDTVFLKNHCTNQYDLNVTVYQSPFPMIEYWYIFILTPKIINSKDIKLNVQYIY